MVSVVVNTVFLTFRSFTKAAVWFSRQILRWRVPIPTTWRPDQSNELVCTFRSDTSLCPTVCASGTICVEVLRVVVVVVLLFVCLFSVRKSPKGGRGCQVSSLVWNLMAVIRFPFFLPLISFFYLVLFCSFCVVIFSANGPFSWLFSTKKCFNIFLLRDSLFYCLFLFCLFVCLFVVIVVVIVGMALVEQPGDDSW